MATQQKRMAKAREAGAPVDDTAPAPDILVTEGTAKFHKLRQGSPNVLLYGKSKQQQLKQHQDPQQLQAPKAAAAVPFHQHTAPTSNRYGPLQQSVLTARRNRLREARDPLPQSAAAKVHATSSGLRHGTRSNKYVRFPEEDILLVQPTQFASSGGRGHQGRDIDDEAQRERHQQFQSAHESDSTLTNNASTNKSLHDKDKNMAANTAQSAAKRKNIMWYRYTDYHGDIEQLKRHGHGLAIREASPIGGGGGMSGSDARLMMSSATTAESKADSNASSAVPKQYLIPFKTRFDYMSRKVPIVTKASIMGEQTHWDWDEEAKRKEARSASNTLKGGAGGLDDGEAHAIEALMEACAPASKAKGGGVVRQWESGPMRGGEDMNQQQRADEEDARGRLHPHSLEDASISSSNHNNNNNANNAYAFVNGADGRRRALPKSGQDGHLPSRMAAMNSTNTVPPHEHLTAKISRDIQADLHAADKNNKWRAAPFTRQHRLWPLSLEREDEFAEGAVSEQEELEEREERPRDGVMNKEAAEPKLSKKRDLPEDVADGWEAKWGGWGGPAEPIGKQRQAEMKRDLPGDVADGWEARWGGWGGPAEPIGKQRQAEMIANVRHLQHQQQRQQHHHHHHHHRHGDKSQQHPHEHLRSRSPSGPRQYFYVPREDSASEFATRDTAVASPYSPRPMAPPSSPDGHHQQMQFYAHEPVTGMLHQQFLSPFCAVAAAEAAKEVRPSEAAQLSRQDSKDALPQHYHRTALSADTPKKRRDPRTALAASDMFRHNSYTLPQVHHHNHNGEGGGASPPSALRNDVNGRSPKQLRRQAKQKRMAADAALEQKMRAAVLPSGISASDPRQAQRHQHLLELQKHNQLQQQRQRNGHHLPQSRLAEGSHQSYNKYAMPGLSVTPGDRIAALKYAMLVPPKGFEVGGANAQPAQSLATAAKPSEYSVADEIESEKIVNGLFHMVRTRRGQQTHRHEHDHERNARRHRNNKK